MPCARGADGLLPLKLSQLPEPRIVAQRRPVWIDAQQGGREQAGHGEHLADVLDGRVRFTDATFDSSAKGLDVTSKMRAS